MRGNVDSFNSTAAAIAGADFALEVPPTPDQVRTARLFAAAVARHFGYPEERIEDLKLAVSEACTNAIKAHSGSNLDEVVAIRAHQESGILRFDVIDAGPGFDQPALDDEATRTPATGLHEGSLGLSVIRSLFPEVEIRRNDPRGMTVSFTISADQSE